MLWVQRTDPGVYMPTPQQALPPQEWAESWAEFGQHLFRLPGMTTWTITMLTVAAIGVAACVVLWQRPRYPIVAAVPVLLVPAAAEFLFIGTREWAATNDHHPRYLLGMVESAQTLLALLAVLPLAGWAAGRGRWLLGGLAALALFAGATSRYGFPSPDRPRRDIEARTSELTAELLAADVDAIGGEYWVVWPAVYHVNMVRREAGDDRMMYGVSDRGRVLLQQWPRSPNRPLRVAVLNTPEQREWFLTYIPVCRLTPPVKIGEHGPFAIYLTYPADDAP
jgi:hypothetical protein